MEDWDQLIDNGYKEITYGNIRKNMYLISPDGKIFSKYKASRENESNFLSPKPDRDGYLELALRTEKISLVFLRFINWLL